MAEAGRLDKETLEHLTDAEEVENLLNSRGWGVIKPKLDALILDLQNINNLDYEKPDTLSMQIAARKLATDLVYGWLKQDVYGFVEQAKTNSSSPSRESESFIVNEDERPR